MTGMNAFPGGATAAPRAAAAGTRGRRGLLRRLAPVGRAIDAVAGWIPLSARGWLVLPLLGWLFRSYGLGREDKVLLALTGAGMALFAVLIILVGAAALVLRFRREAPAGEPWILEAGAPFPTGYSAGIAGWFPAILVQVEWEAPAGVGVEWVRDRRGVLEEVTPTERACRPQVVRRLTVMDAWGLVRLRFRRVAAQEVRILPAAGRAAGVEFFDQRVGGEGLPHPEGTPDGDPMELRRYAPGDPLKMIHWKAFARAGRLLVRLPEKSVEAIPRTLAYFVAGAGDEPSAGVARALLEGGHLGTEFRFGADGTAEAARTVAEALDALARSSAARESGALGLGTFLASGVAAGFSACVMFAPARAGDWLAVAEAEVARGLCPARVVIGVEGAPAGPPPPRWRRLLVADAGARAAAEVAAIRLRLQAAGAEVIVVDRASGGMVDPEGRAKPE